MRENHRQLCSIALAGSFLLVLVGCVQTKRTISLADIDGELRSAITKQNENDEMLLQAISRLGPVTEPASFWTGIANDPSYSLWHRTRAVFALFRRHGEKCTAVAQLAALLKPAIWLTESPISEVTVLAGSIPVNRNPGETVFQIAVLYGPAIYIRLLGEIPVEDFSRMLRGQQRNIKGAQDAVVLQYGYSDDYEAWLTKEVNAAKYSPRK